MSVKGVSPHSQPLKDFKRYCLPVLEKQHIKNLIKYFDKFPEFWEKYCKAYSTPKRALKVDSFNEKDWKDAGQRLRVLRYKYSGTEKAGVEVDENYVISQWKVKKRRKDKVKKIARGDIENNQLITIEENDYENSKDKIVKQKITEIKFVSQITIATVNRINELAKFKELFCRDYIYFLSGGTDEFEIMKDGFKRTRLNSQLSHIETLKQLRPLINNILLDMATKAQNGDYMSKTEQESILRQMNIFEKVMNSALKMDQSSIEFINLIEEGEFSAQKALQGAILNDKSMIDNGQVMLEPIEEKKLSIEENFEEDLKLINESLFDGHLQNISI